jgi:hypothetical protein
MKHITRIDSDNTNGWYVRIRKRGLKFEKLFSDRKYSGREDALKEAKKYLEQCVRKVETHKIKTNVAKIRRTTKKSRGYVYDVFEVSWLPAPGLRKKKSFSIKKYGERKASIEARKFAKSITKETKKATKTSI